MSEKGKTKSITKVLTFKSQASRTAKAVALSGVSTGKEIYHGQRLVNERASSCTEIDLILAQRVSMRLYESRVASMERLTAFFVIFHEVRPDIAQALFLTTRMDDILGRFSTKLLTYNQSHSRWACACKIFGRT